MIVTEIYNGQGLGNQLACYVTTRVLAKDLGYKFGVMNPQKFKCLDFMNLDFGEKVLGGSGPEGGPPISLPDGIDRYYREEYTTHPNGDNITIYNPNLLNISDNTKIDGVLQSEVLIYPHKDLIKKWLQIKPNKNILDFSSENICIINFRGGEYVGHPNLFLNQSYWDFAVSKMRQINKDFEFVVVTDDPVTARSFFPAFDIIHHGIGEDYSIVKNAHYLICSNSSFGYFPAFTSEFLKYAIAPKYWARHNISDGYWSCGYNLYRGFDYIDRKGDLFTYNQCVNEFEIYKKNNKYWN